MIVDHLPPIAARRDNRQFTVKAGAEGAWVTGLVFADENPLYDDANANGIDDAFERKKRRVAFMVHVTLAERPQLAKEREDAQGATPPPALLVQRPMPDRRQSCQESRPDVFWPLPPPAWLVQRPMPDRR